MSSTMYCTASLLLVLALGAGTAQAQSSWKKPSFCRDIDCPMFSVVKTLPNGVELRKYDAASWASTSYKGMSRDNGMSGSFMTLFRYIDGDNSAKAKIPMTAPVLTKIEPGAGPFCNNTFTTSFYNPYSYQKAGANIPKPTNPSVFIQNTPAMEVYVSKFGGFANDDDYKTKATQLMTQLQEANIPFDSNVWFTAGYDSPFTLVNRHNEVWALAKPAAAAAKIATSGR